MCCIGKKQDDQKSHRFIIMPSLTVFEECKHNFDLWLSGVGCPVHGHMQKNPHSCKDAKLATPLYFCRGMSWPVNWYRSMLGHVIRHVVNI